MNFSQYWSKITQKQISKFSDLVRFCLNFKSFFLNNLSMIVASFEPWNCRKYNKPRVTKCLFRSFVAWQWKQRFSNSELDSLVALIRFEFNKKDMLVNTTGLEPKSTSKLQPLQPVYVLSVCWFESRHTYLSFRYCDCFL